MNKAGRTLQTSLYLFLILLLAQTGCTPSQNLMSSRENKRAYRVTPTDEQVEISSVAAPDRSDDSTPPAQENLPVPSPVYVEENVQPSSEFNSLPRNPTPVENSTAVMEGDVQSLSDIYDFPDEPPVFRMSFGQATDENGILKQPLYLSASPQGYVFVYDYRERRNP